VRVRMTGMLLQNMDMEKILSWEQMDMEMGY
jgi:hypothetical protein